MNYEQIFFEKTNMTFTEFYKKYKEKIVWHIMKMVSDRTYAYDLADETICSSLQQIEKYDPTMGYHISTWIFTNARNYTLGQIKKKAKTDSIFSGDEGMTIADSLVSDDTYSYEEDRHNLICKKANMVKKTIYSLPPHYKNVMVMREIDGLSYQDIADYLHINVNTIKSRVKNGREMIKNTLSRDFEKLDCYYAEHY